MKIGVDFSKEFKEEMRRAVADALDDELQRIAKEYGVPNSIPGMDASRWSTGYMPGSGFDRETPSAESTYTDQMFSEFAWRFRSPYAAEAKLEGKIELLARAAAIERQNPGMLRALLTKQEAAGLRAVLEVR